MKPLCIDLFCGLGGWTEGFLSEGFEVVGFDIENHVYGEHRYPAQLVLQDVRTLHGSQFRDAAIIVASSPCQEFSYRAMPWKRAKALGPPLLGMELFAQAGRIQREASEAAGRHIPMVQENVNGAQKYVGRARWHYGSYYLWGDVPALMPMTTRRIGDGVKAGDRNKGRHNGEAGHQWTTHWTHDADAPVQLDQTLRGQKNTGGSRFNIGSPGQKVTNNNPTRSAHDNGVKGFTPHGQPLGKNDGPRKHGSKSNSRKAASAKIAKIPFPLAQWIARVNRKAQAAA